MLRAGAPAAIVSAPALSVGSCFLRGAAQVDTSGDPVTSALATATLAAKRAAPIPADPLEALRAPYLRNITVIRARRDARGATIIRSYVATVERLQREAAARGDLDAAMQIKAEGERVKGG